MSKANNQIKKQLQEIINQNPMSLRSEVAREALKDDSQIETFFKAITRYGCSGGLVNKLIYYYNTHKFYDTYYEEIEELCCELEKSMGTSLHPEGDLKNWYAWLAFEETARIIADELNIEW